MSFWVGVAILAVGLLVSIALHEVGHLAPAKLFGVRVSQYMVGFGRTLFSVTRGETEYGVKAIPLGGYVRMIGMYPPASERDVVPASAGAASEAIVLESTAHDSTAQLSTVHERPAGFWARSIAEAREASASEVPEGQEHRAFYALSVPKKLVVMLGGPLMNLLIAAVAMAVVMSGIGIPQYTSTLDIVQTCVLPAGSEQERECEPGDVEAPAFVAGLQVGDQILAWDGHAVLDWSDVSTAIRAGDDGAVEVLVLRDGRELALTVSPVVVDRPVVDAEGRLVFGEDGDPLLAPAPFVGIAPVEELAPQPLTDVGPVMVESVGQVFRVIATLPQRIASIASSTFGGSEREADIVGLVGVGRFAGEVAATPTDFGVRGQAFSMLQLLASLNLALFAFNLIPLLPLDGGHIVGALWEGARRQLARLRGRSDPGPVDTARLLPLTYVAFIAILGMGLLLAIADIVDPISLLSL